MQALSYQAYSSRKQSPFTQTCAMLAKCGYTEVEGYGGLYADLAATKTAMETHGLRMSSGHFPMDLLENDLDACCKVARELGMQTLYCPYLMLANRPHDVAGWQAFGKRLATVRQRCSDAGWPFGWHNHDFELVALADGSLPLDHLLAADDQLEWEADLAWLVQGGGDIAACVARHGARMSAVHIKDIAPAGECVDEDGWADIGHGTLDWSALLETIAACPVRHYVLEHDNPSDDRRFAQRSMATLSQFSILQD